MRQTPTLSNSKIIAFVMFVSAALITSLFVYHMSHQVAQPKLSGDNGLIFPVPRDIKDFNLTDSNENPFTQKNLQHHWTLLFFGFTHCNNVCPLTLETIKQAYPDLKKSHPDLQVVLVSLDPERDTAKDLAKYTASFHPEFIGVRGKINEIRKLQSQLGVYAARDPESGDKNQLQHTSSIMLITPDGKWAGLLKFGMKPDELTKALSEVAGALNS